MADRVDATRGNAGSASAGSASTRPEATFALFDRRQGRYRPFFIIVSCVFLAVPVSALFSSRQPLHIGLAIVALALIAATLFPALLWRRWRLGRDGLWPPIAILAIDGIAYLLTVSTGVASWISLFYFGAVVGSRVLPDRRAIALIAISGIVGGVAMATAGDDLASAAVQGLSVSLIGLTVFGIATLQRTNAKLLAARDEIARLAVSEERVRIARDLHDTLGHDLSVIALKSELAGRLVASAPDRATAEILDVQRVAREALASVRETVGGYRRPTLDAELAEVRASLAAAGIDVALSRDAAPLPEPVESVLAWAIREGSTNILRHSGSSRASIRIEATGAAATADIEDDGPAREAVPIGADGGAGGPPGHGLAGLRERVAAFGGRIDAGPTTSGGYRLHVAVPLDGATC